MKKEFIQILRDELKGCGGQITMKTRSQRLEDVVAKLLEAQTMLLGLSVEAKANKEWPLAESLDHFIDELDVLIETDKGEAGLIPLCIKIRGSEK